MYIIRAFFFCTILLITTFAMSADEEPPSFKIPQLLEPTHRDLHVILAPNQRTVLSAQISTPILSSQVSAPVVAIYKRMGESFKEGEIILELDTTVFGANVIKAKTVLERSRTVLSARKALFDDDVASLVDLRDAQAAVATAEAELVLALNQYDAAIIRGPYNGKVVTLAIQLYELPQPGQALVEVIQDEILLAKILYPSSYLNELAIDKVIQVEVKETGKIVDAKIIRIGSVIDPSSATIAVDAEVDNKDGSLRAGMTGTTRIRNMTHAAPAPHTETVPQT